MSNFASFADFTILGNSGQESNLRYLESGLPVLNLSIAVDVDRTTYQGEERVVVSETQWFGVPLFGKVAEDVAALVHKGTKVMVKGGVPVIREYTTRDGEIRTKLEIKGGRVIVLSDRRTEPDSFGQTGGD